MVTFVPGMGEAMALVALFGFVLAMVVPVSLVVIGGLRLWTRSGSL